MILSSLYSLELLESVECAGDSINELLFVLNVVDFLL